MYMLPVGCLFVFTESNYHEFNKFHGKLQIFESFSSTSFFPKKSSASLASTHAHTHTHTYADLVDHTCEMHKKRRLLIILLVMVKLLRIHSAVTVNLLQLMKSPADE